MSTRSVKRVLDVIAHRVPDRIPTGELVMDQAFTEALLLWHGGAGAVEGLDAVELAIAGSRLLGHDLICLQSDSPAAGDSPTVPSTAALARMVDAGFFVFWIVDGPFQRVMAAVDFMRLMQTAATDPAALAADLQAAAVEAAAGIERGLHCGAHGIIVADDIAYQKNTYMAPDFGRRYLVPLWRRLAALAAAARGPVFFHSDGNINRFLPLIVEAGFDGLQCIESAAGMDIAAIARQYGQRLTLMGNIDPVLLLDPAGVPGLRVGRGDLDRAVATLIETFAETGGLFLGTSSGLHGGMSPERVYRMATLAGAV